MQTNPVSDTAINLYTLIFADHYDDGGASGRLYGPFVHRTEEEAWKSLWRHVEPRVNEVFREQFIEFKEGLGLRFLSGCNNIYSDKSYFNLDVDRLNTSTLVMCLNWYFLCAHERHDDCFYRVDAHVLETHSKKLEHTENVDRVVNAPNTELNLFDTSNLDRMMQVSNEMVATVEAYCNTKKVTP